MVRGTRRATIHSIHRRDAYNPPAKAEPKTLTPGVRDKYQIARARNRASYKTDAIKSTRPPKFEKATPPTGKKVLAQKLETPQKKFTKPQKKGRTRATDQRLSDKKACKKAGRPKSNKGNGTSREFVPWCSK